MSTDSSQKFCLRWHNYSANFMSAFEESFNNGLMTDVTLFLDDGRNIKCHKMVLAATSEYFREIFMESSCKHPMVFLNNIEYSEMKAILEYMYRGEVNVEKEEVPELLKLAEFFKVKGLFKTNKEEDRASPLPDINNTSNSNQSVESNHNDQPQQPSFIPPVFPPGINPLLNSPFGNDQLTKQWIASLYSQHLNAAMMGPMPSHFQAAMVGAQDTTPKRKKGQSSPQLDTSNPILRNVLAANPPTPPFMMDRPLSYPTSEMSYASAPKSFVNQSSGNVKTSPNYGELPLSLSPHSDQSLEDSSHESTSKGSKGSHRTKNNGKEWKRYKQYTETDINNAIQAVKEEGVSALQASRKFKVPSRTLYDKVKKMGLNVTRAGKRGKVSETVNGAQFPVGIGGNAEGAIYNGFPMVNAPLVPDMMNAGNDVAQFQRPRHDSAHSSDPGSPGGSNHEYPAPMVMINGHVEVARAHMPHLDDELSQAEDLSVKKEVKAEAPGMEAEDA